MNLPPFCKTALFLIVVFSGIVVTPHLAHAATTPRLYVVGKAHDNTYQVNYGVNMSLQSSWTTLGTQQFSSAPMVVDNQATVATHPSIKPMLWIVGIGTDTKTYILPWQLDGTGPMNWSLVPSSPCSFSVSDGHFGVVYVQDTVFLACNGIQEEGVPAPCKCDSTGTTYDYINALNTLNGTWGGWQRIGGFTGDGRHWGGAAPITLTSDGTNVLVLSVTPFSDVELHTIWYATYLFGKGQMTTWQPLVSDGIPNTHYAPGAQRYVMSNTALMNGQFPAYLWGASFQSSGASGQLSVVGPWYNLGTVPGDFAYVDSAVDVNTQPNTQYYAAISKNAALYVERIDQLESSTHWTGWIKQATTNQIFTSVAVDVVNS